MTTRRMLFLLPLAWLGLSFLPWAPGGRAAEPPLCSAASAGTVACIAGRLCRCGDARAGSMNDRPAGYRWDCGVLRPHCQRPPAAAPRGEVLDDLRLIVPAPPIGALAPPPLRPSPRPMKRRPP